MAIEMSQGRFVEKRQVAGEYQPRRLRLLLLRRQDAGEGSDLIRLIDDLRIAAAQRVCGLIGAYRDKGSVGHLDQQIIGRFKLGATAVLQRGFVTTHARAAPAGKQKAEERWRRIHHRFDSRLKSRLPPRLASSRTLSMTMSWESALHMS